LKWIELKREDDIQAIMYEIELLRSLKEDDKIVAILDHLTTPYAIFIIMEFGNIDLAHLLQRRLKKPWDLCVIRFHWKQVSAAFF
jgi:serine/threonine protein kinase